jgi:hypothetical protein
MSKEEKTALGLGQMVSRMIADLRKQAGTETGYARRTVTFPGGEIQLFIVNDSRLSDLFDKTADAAYRVVNAVPASQLT